MQFIKIYEEWFWNNQIKKKEEELDEIERVQEEPLISAEELDEYIKKYQKQKERYNFYLDLYYAGHKKYFNKIVFSLRESTKMLYKIVKSKDVVGNKLNLNEEITEIGDNYVNFTIGDSNEEALKFMYDITFYLNRMYKTIKNKNGVYYFDVVNRVYKFKNKEEVEKKKKEHEEIDPFGEEEWVK